MKVRGDRYARSSSYLIADRAKVPELALTQPPSSAQINPYYGTH